MSTSLLELRGVGKAYQQWDGEWRRVVSWFGLPLRPRREHWVVQDVSFSIRPGETIGIVGGNGAGKSTLLKLITGTTKPSAGSITTCGSVSAILELGMGFNPELTARENVIHVAGMMGIEDGEITGFLPFIQAFSEIGDYFDRPLRTFSSGMQMRVAFALATARRPDLLIVDEALAVGDAHFQHKCFARIREFRDHGTSLLIVSHDHGAILNLCSRAILLERGKVRQDGPPEAVLNYYNALIASKDGADIVQPASATGGASTASGSGEAVVTAVRLIDSQGKPIETGAVGAKVTLEIDVFVNADIPRLVVGFTIKDRLGQVVFGINTNKFGMSLSNLKSGSSVRAGFELDLAMGVGSYSLSTSLHADDDHVSRNYHWVDAQMVFNIVNLSRPHFVGLAWLSSRAWLTVDGVPAFGHSGTEAGPHR